MAVHDGQPNQRSQQLQSSTAEDPPVTTKGSSDSPGRLKELEIASAAKLKSEEYRQLFRLPHGEVLIQDFNCALQENMIYQGHMYVFRNYVCFYSNIFGFETKKVIAFGEITLIRRAKTAGIFPSAIEILTGERKHFFSSFLSRDEAFNLISDLWPDGESKLKENTRQDFPSDPSVQNRKSLQTHSTETSVNVTDDDYVSRGQDVPFTNDSGRLSITGDRSGQITPSEQQEKVEVDSHETNTISSPPSSDLILKQEDTEAPKVSEEFVKVAEATFPIKVDDYFRLFCSDTTFIESFHKCRGDIDFKCTEWRPHEQYGQVRELSFQHPIKFYMGSMSGNCRETQKIQAYKNSHLVVQTSQEVTGVPFADCFTVEGLWDVDNDESGEACVMKVYVKVAFSKKTMWKGKIVQSTMDELRVAFSRWINIAHELLKKKNLEKQELSTLSVDEYIPDHFDLKAETERSSKTSSQTNELERLRLPNDADGHFQCTRNENSIGASCSSSSFGGKLAKLLGIKGNQGYLPHLLVVTVIVVLLMQLTIVLLLSRPPQVQPVYQMDYFNVMNPGLRPSPHELAWVEKRVQHFKKEMIMIETRLEMMRLEHKHLKSQLED